MYGADILFLKGECILIRGNCIEHEDASRINLSQNVNLHSFI